MEFTRWKVLAGGVALAGIAAGGTAAVAADDGIDLNDRRPALSLTAADTSPERSGDDGAAPTVDASPESADSPNESVEDSADSPFDSPDDAGYVDPSPESADSPNDSIDDSADSPFDSPDDAGYSAPAPAAAVQPAPAPVAAGDSSYSDDWGGGDSGDSG